jgi:DNA-binding MarR family transcriptional regulator
MGTLSDKEVAILDQLSKSSSVSQRKLAQTTGISLGLINVILKKFIKAGLIKISYLNKRKMEYLLTPLGRQETTHKAHRQITATIRNYRTLREGVAHLLKQLHASGYDYFSIHGDGELKELVEATFFTSLEESPVKLGKEHREYPRSVVLNVTPDPLDLNFKGDVVDVLGKIGL